MADSLQAQLGDALRRNGKKLVTAESCTGGLIGHWLTDIPGSSEYYLGGVVSYAYEAKRAWLGVSQAMLDEYGAVSREVVLAMAQGARETLAQEVDPSSLIGLAVSGIAGPGGGTPAKPVGLTWIGIAGPHDSFACSYVWQGERRQNKEQSAQQALRLLLDYLEKGESPDGSRTD